MLVSRWIGSDRAGEHPRRLLVGDVPFVEDGLEGGDGLGESLRAREPRNVSPANGQVRLEHRRSQS